MEPDMVVYTYSPNIWEVEAGKLAVQVYPQLHTEFEASPVYIRSYHKTNASQLQNILRYLE